MTKGIAFMMATTLGVGGLTMIGCDRNDTARTTTETRTTESHPDARTTGEKVGDKIDRGMDRAGDAMKNAAEKTGEAAQSAGDRIKGAANALVPEDASSVSEQIKEVVNAAATKGGFDDLVERLAKDDRDRLNEYANGQDFADFDAKAEALQAAWKERFDHQFDLDKAVLAKSISLDNVKTGANNMTTAQAHLPAIKGGNPVTVNMVRESGAWKIDLDNSVTGPALKQSLIKHMDQVLSGKSDWPADINQAYQHVANHVVMALQGAGK